jgi:hypothetical protein
MAMMLSVIGDTSYGGPPNPAVRFTGAQRTATVPTKKIFGKAFTLALLLTGSLRHAEAATLDGIGESNSRQISDRAFLLSCVRAALDPQRQSEVTEDADEAAGTLPLELRRILYLAPDLRHGFVLRALLGLSPEECAPLSVPHVDESFGAAARQLAQAALKAA